MKYLLTLVYILFFLIIYLTVRSSYALVYLNNLNLQVLNYNVDNLKQNKTERILYENVPTFDNVMHKFWVWPLKKFGTFDEVKMKGTGDAFERADIRKCRPE